MYLKNTSHILLWKESESNEQNHGKKEARAWKSELKKPTKKVKVVIAYTFATFSRLVVGSHRK